MYIYSTGHPNFTLHHVLIRGGDAIWDYKLLKLYQLKGCALSWTSIRAAFPTEFLKISMQYVDRFSISCVSLLVWKIIWRSNFFRKIFSWVFLWRLMISMIGMVCSFKWSCGTDSCKFKTSDIYTHCALPRRLSKLEMLKRRGKGPPKKGQGKQAAKRKKNWCLVFLELDYLLNKKAVSLWNSCDNFPGYFPDLFLPKRRFEESMHLLLSYCPLALDVVENCD